MKEEGEEERDGGGAWSIGDDNEHPLSIHWQRIASKRYKLLYLFYRQGFRRGTFSLDHDACLLYAAERREAAIYRHHYSCDESRSRYARLCQAYRHGSAKLTAAASNYGCQAMYVEKCLQA